MHDFWYELKWDKDCAIIEERNARDVRTFLVIHGKDVGIMGEEILDFVLDYQMCIRDREYSDHQRES